MPSAAARRMFEDQLPSFMSIIDPESENIGDRELVTVVEPKFMEMESRYASKNVDQKAPQPTNQHLRPVPSDSTHRHHDSTSTQNSDSADSSPTLTTDTSSLSDPSPSSSPDSPVNLIPLNSFPLSTFREIPTMDGLQIDRNTNTNASERPMTSPGPRKPRNMKGLSIQPPFASSSSNTLVSEPSSPCFIKPRIPGPRKKPSLLSLKTDSQGLNLRPMALEVPGSPSLPPMLQRRSLKHSTSSPHMLSSMKSATFGPAGGMTFPTVFERGTSGLSEVLRPTRLGSISDDCGSTIPEEDSPIKPQMANRAAMDFEPFRDESEINEDQKSPGYPDGPIAIYNDNVYLYLEPTAEEASKFDVVINVAREVHNPFAASKTRNDSVASSGSPEAMIESPIPDTAMTNDSFATAFEYPPREEPSSETPTTPKAAPWNEPEYIHMPWDHNTDIATDLMNLCETIDKRTKEGKKVLVHCQQGASRSASLIIAYGLYQDPGLSVNDAYHAAQAKSRWISPNMRLMYCLQDFQKEVSKKRAPRSSAGPRSGRSPTKHRLTLSADAIGVKPKEPMTAPLPDEEGTSKGSSLDRNPFHSRGKSTSNIEAISPGPSSAPSSFSWSENEQGKKQETIGRFNFGDTLEPPTMFEPSPEPRLQSAFPPRSSSFFKPPPSPGFPQIGFSQNFPSEPFNFGFQDHNIGSKRQNPFSNHDEILPHRSISITSALPDDDDIMSPRVETMTNNPLHDSFTELSGMKFVVESPPTPTEGLFSPRETMFPRNPFSPFGRPSQTADPRSPPTRGETPITRSIDEIL
ncbi:hypothetical protein F5B22DRAFT_4098 [Xylaria bambusicola]|uniref:uncharacterized protein n=1 Tax=Xylaria bambusicola TaxID=326684 RepID=UPI0020079E4C|nr:uncharacterized protein F5B22DRAFT_4098 [Xylaria bambusicola]KAI0527785.1 hypothetical protein F5B22DRAFT_4098 [Xylaria bambusicola]